MYLKAIVSQTCFILELIIEVYILNNVVRAAPTTNTNDCLTDLKMTLIG